MAFLLSEVNLQDADRVVALDTCGSAQPNTSHPVARLPATGALVTQGSGAVVAWNHRITARAGQYRLCWSARDLLADCTAGVEKKSWQRFSFARIASGKSVVEQQIEQNDD